MIFLKIDGIVVTIFHLFLAAPQMVQDKKRFMSFCFNQCKNCTQFKNIHSIIMNEVQIFDDDRCSFFKTIVCHRNYNFLFGLRRPMNQPAMNRMDRKKEEMRNRIIDSAIKLFDRFGIDEVTMDQIAEQADVAKGTLYNYFSSKDTVIAAYIQRSFNDHDRERIEAFRRLPNTEERLSFILMLLIQGIERQKELFEKYMLFRMRLTLSFSPISSEMESGLSSLIEEIIRLGRDEGDIRTDLPADMIVGFVEYILIAAIKPYYLQPETFDPKAIVDACISLFINGSKPKKSEKI